MTQFGPHLFSKPNVLWPKVDTLQSAKNAGMQAFWVTIILIAISTALAIRIQFDEHASDAAKDVLLGALIFLPIQALIAWQIRRMSRIAAVTGLVSYFLGQVVELADRPVKSLGFLSIIIIGLYINGIRGTFAFHRLNTISKLSNHIPVPTSGHQHIRKKTSKIVTERERYVLLATVGILVLMLIFPPFYLQLPSKNGIVQINHGYGFIFSPPKTDYPFDPSVNVPLLAVQCLIVTIIGCILFIVVRTKKGDQNVENN